MGLSKQLYQDIIQSENLEQDYASEFAIAVELEFQFVSDVRNREYYIKEEMKRRFAQYNKEVLYRIGESISKKHPFLSESKLFKKAIRAEVNGFSMTQLLDLLTNMNYKIVKSRI